MLAHSDHNGSRALDMTARPGAIEEGSAAFGIKPVPVTCQRVQHFPYTVIRSLWRLEVRSHLSHRLGTLRADTAWGRFTKHLPTTEAHPMTSKFAVRPLTDEFIS